MTDLEQKLLCRIQKVHCFGIDTENTETILESVNHPRMEQRGEVHDWRNHVDGDIRDLWPAMSLQTRCAITLMAMQCAEDEEWD